MKRVDSPLRLVAPGTYTIRVQGRLDLSWSERLGGMRITASGTGRHTVTTLTGRLADQAALLGVLNALYDLGLPLLTVEFLPPP